MGCTQSKIENEEAVSRCKDRKLFMKNAVSARNAFAAAHSAYAMCLKNTGAALSDYAHGESHHLQHPHASSSSAAAALPSSAASYDSPLPPPPPPLPNFPSPLQRAVSMPEISGHKPDPIRSEPIIEEENEEEIENDSHSLKHRTSRSSGGGGGSRKAVKQEENLAPPPPTSSPPRTDRAPPPPPPPESKGMSWDFFFPPMDSVPGPSLAEVDDDGKIEREREEMERKMREEMSNKKRAEEVSIKAEVAEVAEEMEEMEEVVAEQLPPQPPASKAVKKSKPPPSRREGKSGPNVNLLQIFGELDDCFLKASESAHEVSKMLEANRLHYHSNFADNRGHIDHSARVMRVITWNKSFRGLPNTDDGMDDIDSEEHETHATVLDKMLAWEKKLYDEVKTGEQMKLDYQKKVSSLNKLKKRGASTESIEKTKAALSHLHTRYIVDMQSMDSTVSEINRLRDAQLYPKLVALVDGMATMWETMQKHHESQSKIVTALKYLDMSQSPKETSEHHHNRTLQLWGVAQEWHSQFVKLMTHQKEYVKALKDWLKLNLIPIDNNLKEKVSSPQRPQNPPIQSLLLAWHENFDKLTDDVARTAISNFAAVMDTIVQFQEDEMKLRDKCEETRKELIRKQRQYEEWYNKYMQRRTPPDEMDSERSQDKELIAERQSAVEMLKRKLEEEEEAYNKQCILVRDKSLMTLKTCLPELFRAMRNFSVTCSGMYSKLRSISQPHKPNESL